MGWILEWGVLFSLTRPLAASSLSVFHSMLGAVGLAPAKRAPISPQRQLSSLGVPSPWGLSPPRVLSCSRSTTTSTQHATVRAHGGGWRCRTHRDSAPGCRTPSRAPSAVRLGCGGGRGGFDGEDVTFPNPGVNTMLSETRNERSAQQHGTGWGGGRVLEAEAVVGGGSADGTPCMWAAFSCKAGEFLDMKAQACKPCAEGTYSLGTGVRFDEWDELPHGFANVATNLELDDGFSDVVENCTT